MDSAQKPPYKIGKTLNKFIFYYGVKKNKTTFWSIRKYSQISTNLCDKNKLSKFFRLKKLIFLNVFNSVLRFDHSHQFLIIRHMLHNIVLGFNKYIPLLFR